MAAGVVHVPWYATGFRADKLEAALADVTNSAQRYGATAWFVHRSRDDRYKFVQGVTFSAKADFERWWAGSEMVDFRAICSGWFQIPVIYVWNDIVSEGRIDAAAANGNGHTNGVPAITPTTA